jgi:hypothetical protein
MQFDRERHRSIPDFNFTRRLGESYIMRSARFYRDREKACHFGASRVNTLLKCPATLRSLRSL